MYYVLVRLNLFNKIRLDVPTIFALQKNVALYFSAIVTPICEIHNMI